MERKEGRKSIKRLQKDLWTGHGLWVEQEEKAGRLLAEVLTAGWELGEIALLVSEQGRCSKEVNFSSRMD